jgi:hypothetical protein
MDMEQSVVAQETQRRELTRTSVATFDEVYIQSHDQAFKAMLGVTRDPDRTADSLGTAYLRAVNSTISDGPMEAGSAVTLGVGGVKCEVSQHASSALLALGASGHHSLIVRP